MSAIVPNPQAFQQLAAAPDNGPVVMLNLLKFKKQARRRQRQRRRSLRPLRRCRREVRRADAAASILWQGRAEQLLVGEAAEQDWDVVALVQYPSRKAFLEDGLEPRLHEEPRPPRGRPREDSPAGVPEPRPQRTVR